MGWIVKDFECSGCGNVYEDLVSTSTEEVPSCPQCEGVDVSPVLSCPNIASFSIMEPAERAKSLKKRSAEHSLKQLAKEPEKFGKAGVAQYQASKKKV